MDKQDYSNLLEFIGGLLAFGWPVLLGGAVWAVLWKWGYPWAKREK